MDISSNRPSRVNMGATALGVVVVVIPTPMLNVGISEMFGASVVVAVVHVDGVNVGPGPGPGV